MTHYAKLGLGVGALCALLSSTAVHAALINANGTGINYTLTEATTANPLVDRFTLTITGINAATDTEGGRSGVNGIALTPPTGFVTAVMTTPPSGFVLQDGGLNSSGCNLSGNFFCFNNTAIPDTGGPSALPPFAANTTLTFVFTETLAAGNTFTGYDPAFKIDWVGDKNNYDLISLEIGIDAGGPPPPPPPPPPPVPEPASLAIFGSALAGLGLLRRLRRRRSA